MGRPRKMKFVNFPNFCCSSIHFLPRRAQKKKRNTPASYAVSKLIGEKIKLFVEGEVVMKCLMAFIDIVYPEKIRYFHPLVFLEQQLQDKLRMSVYVKRVQRTPVTNLNIFFVAFDKSTDLKDTAQLAVFVRGVLPSLDTAEEFVLISMKNTTIGEDVCKALQTVMADMTLNLSNLLVLHVLQKAIQ